MNQENRRAVEWKVNEKNLGLEQSMWHRRIVEMYAFIDKEDKSVMDLGAGNMHLKKLLDSDVTYYPVDYTKRFEETIVCDFNAYEFPDVNVDVIVCAGILGYMNDPQWFLEQVTTHCTKVLLSYQGREKFGYSMLYTSEVIEYMNQKGFYITQKCNKYLDNWTLIACFEKKVEKILECNPKCTGCGACINRCPFEAIEMFCNEEGYWKPVVNRKKCRHCNQCIDVCPTLGNVETLAGISEKNVVKSECYAVWASDEVRLKSSSGGVFTVVSESILNHGGYVFGAEWTDDFYCHHVGISDIKELDKLRCSKYVQSNTERTFTQVKKLLQQEIPVAYFGCPCQIAGLKAYLGELEKSEKLLTIDLICFCAPSVGYFRKYLEENYGVENVNNVVFREKSTAGWSPIGYRIDLSNGNTCFPKADEDMYQQAFHNVLARSQVCETCEFADFPRQGDLTIGDFWGIDRYDQSWNDGKGTSVILANSNRGRAFLKQISPCFQRYEAVPLDWVRGNGNRLGKDGRAGHKNRAYFKRLLQKKDFNTSVQMAMKDCYDVGLVYYMNHNIGNNLTNYALYQYLCDEGYFPLVIDAPKDTLFSREKVFDELDLFIKVPYFKEDLAEKCENKFELMNLNDKCDCFVLGSDQLLRQEFIIGTDYYTCLDWVHGEKYKISYGSSFGKDVFEGDSRTTAKSKFMLQRFQAISVREATGVDLVQSTFNLRAEFVMDPVFLCNMSHYEEMAHIGKIRIPENPYIGAYILDGTDEREKLILNMAKKLSDGEHLLILDPEKYDRELYQGRLNNLNYPKVEEWLAMIKNCEFFITDSFHGLCFALIFKKQFCIITDSKCWRGFSRIQSLLKMLGLEKRIAHSAEEAMEKELWNEYIDYATIDKVLFKEISKSRNWLLCKLTSGKEYIGEYTTYDALMEYEKDRREYEKAREAKEYQQKLDMYRLRHDFYMAEKSKVSKDIIGTKRCEMQVVAWGAGDCFRRNIERIHKFCDLKWVCDNDPNKWGEELADGVRCISPAKLKEMQDVCVIIMIDSAPVAFQIVSQLLEMGIVTFEHVENWLKYVEEGLMGRV